MEPNLPHDFPPGLATLFGMVRIEDRGKVVALALNATNRKETDMGLIPETMDDAYQESEVATGEGGGLLPAGPYQGTVVECSVVAPEKRTWRDAECLVKIQVTDGEHAGKVAYADFELAPLKDKAGAPSAGKMKWAKFQLQSLGFEGKLSDFEYEAQNCIGAIVDFEQVDKEGANTNPNTGLKYRDREVKITNCVTPGVGASTQAPAPTGQTAVY